MTLGRSGGREWRPDTPTEVESGTVDAPRRPGGLVEGAELGGRYQVRSRIGAGGMGEVWRAFDLKLRVEVALKALRPEAFEEEHRHELLRREVRAAREVVSPNVCRVYDLVEADGRELVSMEYVDGQTLLAVLRERGPLALKEAQDIASQFLAGLEAIHRAGLVHRDVKPENIMVTRAGRVVVMDFGLARQEADPARSASGTPAYMAPEQARGEALDSRADVYSAAVVLAEMVHPEGIRSLQSRQSVWEGMRSEPPKLPDTPWAPVLRRAVAREPERRYATAHTLTRALEEVTLRVVGAEDLRPYPGLASFSEDDAAYFFGREAEVEAMWRKLEGPARLLGLAGPSGAGKSSFLRAGLMASAGPTWGILLCTPGSEPLVGLGQALAREMAGDAEVAPLLVRAHEHSVLVDLVGRWRRRHDDALVIVDQLEELFTQSAVEEQRGFADLLGRLVLDADVHVLLSMREDFLLRCHDHEALRPLFADLTPLAAPAGANLRRALTQPALACGYRFEDDGLVEEMLGAVAGERGALPLLAFAVARLWEQRDRGTGLLTRESYRDIGGVGGALARHAETAMDRIGVERIGLVRELFRNLVTAEGTRAVREWHELLSVFDEAQRASAEEVLRALVTVRLLTSYELRQDEGEPARRVEIIHESLLASWPRLQRWQVQDAEGALLRDQLRQAARTWHEHGRSDDLLWTGTAYREYAVWRERYPGGLSELEEAFAAAMTSLATRRRRRRRIAVAVAIAVLAAGLAVVGSFWRRAVQETHHREAAQLLALGQLRLADSPSAALAFAIASLERADTEAGRRFAVEALAQGPPALFLTDPEPFWNLAWSPDGRFIALGGSKGLELLERGTDERRRLSPAVTHNLWPRGFTADGRHLVRPTIDSNGEYIWDVWSIPEGRREHTFKPQGKVWLVGDRLLSLSFDTPGPRGERAIAARLLSLDGTTERELGIWRAQGRVATAVDPTGTWLVSLQGGQVLRNRLDSLDAPPWVLGTCAEDAAQREGGFAGDITLRLGPWRDRAVLSDTAGEVRVWDLASGRLLHALRSPADAHATALDPGGRFLATAPYDQVLRPRSMYVFDLAAPATAEPLPLLESSVTYINDIVFSPGASWLAGCHGTMAVLWNMSGPHSVVVGRAEMPSVVFADDRHLLSGAFDGVLRRWPLRPGAGVEVEEVWSRAGVKIRGLELSFPGRRSVAVSDDTSWVNFVVPLDGATGEGSGSERFPREAGISDPGAIDPSGRLLAFNVFLWGQPEPREIRLADLSTGAERTLDTRSGEGEACFAGTAIEGRAFPMWLPDGRLLSDGDGGLREWDLETGSSRQLLPCTGHRVCRVATADSRTVVCTFRVGDQGTVSSPVMIVDLPSGATREIPSHGNRVGRVALDPTGTILVTGDREGVIRVGSLTGEEPHLLFGHTGEVRSVAVSPDGRRIASSGADGTIRLWPMPDLSKPPLHTLPHDELVAKLESLTNLRAVPDPASGLGYKIEIGPFPGWATVPEWQP